MKAPSPLLLVLATFLLLIPAVSSACLSAPQISCLLHDDSCNDTALLSSYPNATKKVLLGRIRFPGTASSHEFGMFDQQENVMSRFDGLANLSGCSLDKLCFNPKEEADRELPFGALDLSGWGAHSAFDVIEGSLYSVLEKDHSENVNNENDGPHLGPSYFPDANLMTTLRGVGTYSHKWYAFRHMWDRVGDLENVTFEEWIDLAPWRHNVLTRMLGSKPDRKAMPKNLLYTSPGQFKEGPGEFLHDQYMLRQNQLGPAKSEVYSLALERLREMVHFSLFHRLLDSWELMAYNFCWDLGNQKYRPDKEIIGLGAVETFVVPAAMKKGMRKDEAKEEAIRIWTLLKDRNRLDMALMEEAEKIFDERMERMKIEKADGVVCNFFGRVKVRCASNDGIADDKRRYLR